MNWPRVLPAFLAIFVGAVLSGCASIPTSGPIVQGEEVGYDSGSQVIRVIARPPQLGMSPTQIVSGFLEASASFDNDHEVAREYLTESASSQWRPTTGAKVYEGSLNFVETGESVLLSGTRTATIDSVGRFSIAAANSPLSANYNLVKIDGEWRISELPSDLILSQADIDRAYRTFNVYFFDTDYSMLVPDPRTIPLTNAGLATTLIKLLIAGPSDWLAPAVRTAIPDGVGLELDSVPIEDGVARVDLTAGMRNADEQTQQAVSAQLVWTLRQLSSVGAIDVRSGGQPIVIPGMPSPQPRDAWPEVNPDGTIESPELFGVADGRVNQVTPDGVESVSSALGSGAPNVVAVSADVRGSTLAAVDRQGGVWLGPVVGDDPAVKVADVLATTAPAFHPDGDAWVVSSQRGLVSVDVNGNVAQVLLEGFLPGSSIVRAVPSRDGTRVALVVRTGARTQLLVGRIVRDGAATTVSRPIRVESRLIESIDVSWSSADSLAVLGAEAANAVQLFSVDLGRGAVLGQGAPSDPVTVAAYPAQPLMVGTRSGRTFQAVTGAWVSRFDLASPAYPG